MIGQPFSTATRLDTMTADEVALIGGTITGCTITNCTIGSSIPTSGVFTTLSASGQITSTLGTGTAPLVVASTTRVSNLNAATAGNADTVTTNANLTGPITSVGNATSIASQTGTGTKFVVDTSPTIVTPTISGHFTAEGVTTTGAQGTGALVFATSPTLTTPNIGAATGTSLSVSGQLTSTVTTGTAPLVVSSTTAVANLNASLLLGSTWAAPAAIGTGTPAAATFTTVTANTSVTSPWYSATGAIPGYGGSKVFLDYANGGARLQSTGADGSTMGTVVISQGVNNYASSRALFTADASGTVSLMGNPGAESLRVVTVASAVNTLQSAGSVTTAPVVLSAIGTDTNIDIQITPKGTGVLYLGNASSFTANGSVATTMTSLGPTGSHTTIQEWLTVKNSSGTVRYIPAY